MRKYYIAGNWKMHTTMQEARNLIENLKPRLDSSPHKVMVAPPFTALAAAAEALKGSSILLGAQNMASASHGAHTGEVSIDMLIDVGVKVVIIGHSERRQLYGETDTQINTKIKLAHERSCETILCVGETLEERETGKQEEVVQKQLDGALVAIPETALSLLTIAYEPIWAIGTGKTATPHDANKMHAAIRAYIRTRYSAAAADAQIIQYGGSVKPENAYNLLNQPDIDGALVGGASLDADTFIPIVAWNEDI